MPALSTYLRNKLRDWHDDTAFPTDLATVYLALYTSATGPGAEGTEVPNTNNYSRTPIAASAIVTDGDGVWTTNAEIATAIASGSWGNVTHVALTDSGTHGAGNRVAYAALTTPRTVSSGQRLVFAAGAIAWDGSGI